MISDEPKQFPNIINDLPFWDVLLMSIWNVFLQTSKSKANAWIVWPIVMQMCMLIVLFLTRPSPAPSTLLAKRSSLAHPQSRSLHAPLNGAIYWAHYSKGLYVCKNALISTRVAYIFSGDLHKLISKRKKSHARAPLNNACQSGQRATPLVAACC